MSIVFFNPGIVPFKTEEYSSENKFFSFSITGRKCALNCEHCKGKFLKYMRVSLSPKKLKSSMVELIEKYDAIGFLISGGADRSGHVPLEPYMPVIAEVKKEYGVKMLLHTGVNSEHMVPEFASAGIDRVMFDIIGDEKTMREVYHLNESPEIFDKYMTALENAGIKYSPHILVGLYWGRLSGEYEAIDMLRKHKPASVVIISLVPLKDTPMEGVMAPPPDTVSSVIEYAKSLNVPISLGCARPMGIHRREMDIKAIDSGVNGIAFPMDESIKYAKKIGVEYEYRPVCCALVDEYL